MRVLAIDPGTERSAAVLYDTEGMRVEAHVIVPNAEMLRVVQHADAAMLLVEMVESYGMPVGRETFETVFWIGRFVERFPRDGQYCLLSRRAVKLQLCGSSRAKDANVRQAVIDRLGPKGTKANKGATYGIKADEWSALAVAVAWDEMQLEKI